MNECVQSLFSANDFAQRVRHWKPDHDDLTGDHLLNPDFTQSMVTSKMRDAAVLVPVVDRGPEATLLLTRRTEKLRKHSGQIAFRRCHRSRRRHG